MARMLLPPDPVLPEGYVLRPMTDEDLPAVHALETRLFPHDAWPLQFFEEELSQAGPQDHGRTRDYRVVEASGAAGAAGTVEAAEAAGAPGAFWEMRDLLFAHQDALTAKDVIGYARELGLDVQRFREDLR